VNDRKPPPVPSVETIRRLLRDAAPGAAELDARLRRVFRYVERGVVLP
jgi:hypothetical protein